jgi:hypothetical protein
MTTARLKDDKDAKTAGWVVGILLLGAFCYFFATSSHDLGKNSAVKINSSDMQSTLPNQPNHDPTKTPRSSTYNKNYAGTVPQLAGKYSESNINR